MAHASLQKVTQLMEGAIEHLKREFTTLRTGRASIALLDHITVEYYGTPTPLKQVASLSIPESRLIHIQQRIDLPDGTVDAPATAHLTEVEDEGLLVRGRFHMISCNFKNY